MHLYIHIHAYSQLDSNDYILRCIAVKYYHIHFIISSDLHSLLILEIWTKIFKTWKILAV